MWFQSELVYSTLVDLLCAIKPFRQITNENSRQKRKSDLKMSLVFTQLLSKVLDKKPIGFIDVGSRGGIHELVDKFAAHVDVLAFDEINIGRIVDEGNNAFGTQALCQHG